MIRLIVDTFGGRHKDLFLIVDSTPWHLKVADSYFLYDFLEIDDIILEQLNLADTKLLKYAAIQLLNYWSDRIKAIQNGQAKFIPFDFSDQYVGGLMLEKVKTNFRLKLVWTDKITALSISKSNIDRQIIDGNITFKDLDSIEWYVSEEGLYNGIDWSIKELLT